MLTPPTYIVHHALYLIRTVDPEIDLLISLALPQLLIAYPANNPATQYLHTTTLRHVKFGKLGYLTTVQNLKLDGDGRRGEGERRKEYGKQLVWLKFSSVVVVPS